MTPGSLLLRNALLLDPAEGSYVEGDIQCADGRIVEVGTGLTAPDARTEDLRGAVVMPGLVDAHVHVTALTADLASIPARLVYGSDLLGGMHRHQKHEFRLRAEVQPPIEVIRSATSIAAELVNMTGEIGTLRPGAQADLLVLVGDPLADIGVLVEPKHLRYVVQRGNIVS